MRSRFFGISDEALRLLAPEVSQALRSPAIPAVWSQLAACDQLALGEARNSARRWLGFVDRLPAAELIDVILSEAAYGVELRGPRFPQARENLKKMRSLMRRIQNRGYGTLARMAAHLDRLAVGDEANAAIDAFDAVNLMTVHAAKGLEFPVVFVVNLARGSGSRRDPVRVTADPSGDGGSVAVGDFQSDADDDHAAREREETKRLLYVALTRARDRLYLGTVLKDGLMQPGRGSLGEVLPLSLRDQFVVATDATEWRASSGTMHSIRVCCPATTVAREPAKAGPHVTDDVGASPCHVGAGFSRLEGDRQPDDFATLTDTTPAAKAVAASVHDPSVFTAGPIGGSEHESDRVVGTLVHRMLERFGFDGDAKPLTRQSVLALFHARSANHAEAAEGSAADVCERALAAYRAICCRPEIRSVYMSGERWHEVPFTMRLGESVWRGTIDCLVQTSPTIITVLEFKTGRRRKEHDVQLQLYREAASRLFPGMTIETQLVYPGAPAAV